MAHCLKVEKRETIDFIRLLSVAWNLKIQEIKEVSVLLFLDEKRN